MNSGKIPSFSNDLESWLKSDGKKTLKGLSTVFAEKSFAISFLLLMSIPALPIPTGGITHVFEIITMLLSLELIVGLDTVWLPKKWEETKLGPVLEKKALPFILKRVRWFEKYSRPRLSKLLENRLSVSLIGAVVFGLALTAFVAPPFSGLDTLPALGIVFIAMGMILEDVVGAIIGFIVGGVGVFTVIGLGKVIINFFFH